MAEHNHEIIPKLTAEQTQAAILMLRDLQARGVLLRSTVETAMIVLLDNLLEPDMSQRIEQVEPSRRGRLRTVETQMKTFTASVLERGRRGLLELSDEDFDALVEEANADNG